MDEVQLAAEQRAHVLVDRQLADVGWEVQHKNDLNLFAGQGVAVREVIMASGYGRADSVGHRPHESAFGDLGPSEESVLLRRAIELVEQGGTGLDLFVEMVGLPVDRISALVESDHSPLVVVDHKTGFGEPYLHRMFVDKKLAGLNAVQALSRLNRSAPGKADTFVLDFRNEAEEIRKAFQRFFEAVIVEPTDANVLYDLRARIMSAGILDPTEISNAAEVCFGVDPEKRSLKVVHANLDPAVVRFAALALDDQDSFKDAVDQFVRAYAFLSQVMPFSDAEFEKLYAKALRTLLREAASGGLDLGDDLVLTNLRLLRQEEVELQLNRDGVEVPKVFIRAGQGAGHEPEKESLAELIAAINERFGTDLDERDRLEAEKVQITLSADEELKTYAVANPIDNFALEFSAKFKSAILDTEAHTERLYNLLLSNPELSAMIEAEVMKATYLSMRADLPDGGEWS